MNTNTLGRTDLTEQDANDELRSSRVIWTTLLVVVTFFTWAYWAEIDEITRAQGEVVASSRTQIVQAQDGGSLQALFVREGDVVEQGQLLARIDQTRAEAGFLEAQAQVAGLTATLARLEAEAESRAPAFPAWLDSYPNLIKSELQLIQKRQETLSQQQQSLLEVKDLLSQELSLNRPLLNSGDVSLTEVLRLERQLAEVEADVVKKRTQWFEDVQERLSEVRSNLAMAEQRMAQQQSLLDQTELMSPMRGVVKNVRITTLGGIIRPGEEVMQIVPLEDDLVIEARLSPRDIAFLSDGLEARVKIDAYDYTIYGDMAGELIFISADTLKQDLQQGEEPYFLARVKTNGKRFSGVPDKDLEIQTGMTATVEVKTGRRSVLEYLTKPIVKTLARSLGER